jgi:splicing factor 3B subunit 1
VGGAEIIKKLEPELRDENEQYRRILMETVEKIILNQGVADINSKLEEKLMDGMLFAF